MSNHSIKQEIQKLRDDLNHHNHLYYVLDQPKISDFEFDALMNRLIDLESQYPEFFDPLSPTVRVGGGLVQEFKTVKHNYPMLSLANTYSQLELKQFDDRVKRVLNRNIIDYTCELKYDGVAISLVYKNGLLVRGVTRGDGFNGDDVTTNIKTVKSIPLKLFGTFPKLVELRGEVFIQKAEFHKINLSREKKRSVLQEDYQKNIQSANLFEIEKLEKQFLANMKKLEKYSNPRNFASGSLKLLDSSKVAQRNLDCVIYSIHGDNLPFNSHYENLSIVKKWGFKISKHIQRSSSVEDIMQFIKSAELHRDNLPFEIDGVVIKVNKINHQEELGNTAKSPRWAISYKFKSMQVKTVLHSIVYQIGRTGAITPVAELNPVYLAGSLIKRASLHNEDFIRKLGLKIGDTVLVEKGGDVIPKVVSVDLKKRNLLCQDIVFVSTCPSCGSKLHRFLNEANYYCLNMDDCAPQKIAKVEHYISRDALNINTLGSKTVELLFKEKLIDNVADLYDLCIDDLTHLKGFGEKSQSIKKAQNILTSIEESKSQPFEKVLYGLGIRHVGKTVSKKLTEKFLSIDNLIQSSRQNLLNIDEIGEKIANSVFDFLENTKNQNIVQRLRMHGLQFQTKAKVLQSRKFDELIFVISGTFSISRAELKDIILVNGGRCNGSISKKTNYLVAGDNMGPKKTELALSLGIPIISEIELKKMLE